MSKIEIGEEIINIENEIRKIKGEGAAQEIHPDQKIKVETLEDIDERNRKIEELQQKLESLKNTYEEFKE